MSTIRLSNTHLSPLEPGDVDHLYTWLQDPEITLGSTTKWIYPHSREDITTWFLSRKTNHAITLGIKLNTSTELIGYTGLSGIDWIERHANYYVVIGEKSHWGKGIATEVTQGMLAYGFNDLNLNRIELSVQANNIAAIKAYEKNGFTREGVNRQAVYRNGQYQDRIIMGILKEEFRAHA